MFYQVLFFVLPAIIVLAARVDTDTFLLQNLYTHKTFEPKNGAVNGSPLIQKTLDGTRSQCWEFVKNGGSCAIRLKGTELYKTNRTRKEKLLWH